MPMVTFQVLEGIDKGRIYRNLATPVTIGREEGNALRLNDERVSRFHAKIQADNSEIILTDLESTNGTRVNGHVVQIRRLQVGDRVNVGRSLLLFGSEEEIARRVAQLQGALPARGPDLPATAAGTTPATVHVSELVTLMREEREPELDPRDKLSTRAGTVYSGKHALPPVPQKLTPSQVARLSEILDFLHKQLTAATENVANADAGPQITLAYADWQRVLSVQMVLARYVRAVTEPDALDE